MLRSPNSGTYIEYPGAFMLLPHDRFDGFVRAFAFVAAVSCVAGFSASAQAPYRLNTIGSPSVQMDSSPSAAVQLGTVALFTAFDRGHGVELWRTDGTPAGTELVKDINPGTGSGLTQVNGTLVKSGTHIYFAGFDDDGGSELWITDGSTAGTVRVKDICPGSCSSSVGNLVDVSGTLYFTANDGEHGVELWRSQGTAATTALVKDINPNPNGNVPAELTAVNGTLFFAADDGVNGYELWKSNGSEASTTMVADINPGPDSSGPGSFRAFNGGLLFVVNLSGNMELWRSNGTQAGTTQLATGFNYIDRLSVVGSTTFFSGTIYATSGQELWKTDGTVAGTMLVKDICPGTCNSSALWLTPLGGTLYFSATDGATGVELWKSDGSTAGTTLVADICSGCSSNAAWLTALGSQLIFAASTPSNGVELWSTDGTAAGTTLVSNINPGSASSFPSSLSSVLNRILFSAYDAQTGRELWSTDGTGAGTFLLKNIAVDGYAGSYPSSFTPLANGKVVFSATEPNSGGEVWVSDATSQGTFLLKDIQPGSSGSLPRFFTSFGNLVLLNAGNHLWKTDGTAPGTQEVLSADFAPGFNPQQMVAFNGAAYFNGYDPATYSGLFRTDGTSAGTVQITGVANPSGLTVAGGAVYFSATPAGGSTYGLWRTDGTAAGTRSVKDFPLAGNSAISWITDVNGTVFFKGDPSGYGNSGTLWKTDGSSPGTTEVRAGLQSIGNPANLKNAGGVLLFGGFDPTYGYELFRSDGTTAGTGIVKDINPSGDGVLLPSFEEGTEAVVLNNTYYFIATDGSNGFELWKSDGTAANTVMVKDICAGSCSSNPRYLTGSGNRVFFRATSPSTGDELWMSDGTDAGTMLVSDIEPGNGGSAPANLKAVRNVLYFAATTSAYGTDPYVACTTSTTHFALTLPAIAVSAEATSLGVMPADAGNLNVPCYTGTVHITSSEATDTLPGDYAFSATEGAHTFLLTMRKLGTHTITVTDAATSSIISSAVVTVIASPVNTTMTAVPATIFANGSATSTITVQLKDANNTNITSGGDNLVLATDLGTLTAPTNNNNGSYSAALKGTVAGTATVTGTLSGVAMTHTATVNLLPGPATSFAITAPSNAISGAPFDIGVTALDANNNVASSYAGTIHFSVNDSGPTLPANYDFQPDDNGAHTFTNGVTLRVVGNRTITVTDTSNASISGVTLVFVSGATTTNLTTSANPQNPGTAVTFTATVTTTASGSSITGSITFNEGAATLGTVALSSGSASFTTSSLSSGPHAISATYSGNTNYLTSTSAVLTEYITLPAPLMNQPAYAGGANTISWPAVNYAAQYEVQRSFNHSAFVTVAMRSSSQLDYADSAVNAGVAYLYKVRAIDGGANPGFISLPVLSTTIALTDSSIAVNTTPIKATHISELRAAIDAVRSSAGLAAASYSRSVNAGEVMQSTDVSQMRTALDAARAILGLPSIPYVDAGPPAGMAVRKAHVHELRIGAGCTAQ